MSLLTENVLWCGHEDTMFWDIVRSIFRAIIFYDAHKLFLSVFAGIEEGLIFYEAKETAPIVCKVARGCSSRGDILGRLIKRLDKLLIDFIFDDQELCWELFYVHDIESC